MNKADYITIVPLTETIRQALGPHLLTAEYRRKRPAGVPPSWGCCYVAAEALYHSGGRQIGYRPEWLRTENGTHWYLRHPLLGVLDITADQFQKTPDYSQGHRAGFLTRKPSKRCRLLLRQISENTAEKNKDQKNGREKQPHTHT